MALDATVGGASSNSYVTQADATTYFGHRFDATEWTNASSDNRNIALMMATARLEQEEYTGLRVDDDQRLKWPRYGVYVDNVYQEETAVPRPIKEATYELAPIKEATYELALAFLKDSTLLADTGLEGFQSVKLGELDVTPRFRSGGTLPANVERLLRGLKTTLAYTGWLRRA
jgi:hypothetical protein